MRFNVIVYGLIKNISGECIWHHIRGFGNMVPRDPVPRLMTVKGFMVLNPVDQPGQHIKKQSHYFANKDPSSQGYGFSNGHVWMWELDCEESWVPRIDAFELWCWRRLLRVPWTARKTNQSILKEISPGCSLEGLMLKLKLQYFGHLMWRVDSLEKTLMLGGIGGRRRRGPQRMRWLMASLTQWTWIWVDSGRWWWTGRHAAVHEIEKSLARLSNWTELNW